MIRKLLIIILGIFLVICAGSCNLYPLYLTTMMNKFGFTLKQVNLYGSFINIGLWVAFPMGYIYDRLGPKVSCIIGSLLLSGSYLTLHFLFNSDVADLPLVLFLFIGLVMGQGSALCYTTSVTTNLKNFRFKESSVIVGLLVANLALSPSVFTTYREYMKEMHTANFFMVISIFTAIVICICGFVFHNIRNLYSEDNKSYEQYKEMRVIYLLIIINICILSVYTIGVVINNSSESRFPLVIVYPCLQALNFIIVILEKCKVFDKFYFKKFVNMMIAETLKMEEIVKNKEIALAEKPKDNGMTDTPQQEIKSEDTLRKSINTTDNFVEIQMGESGSKLDANQSVLSSDSNNKSEPILPKEETDIPFFNAISSVEHILLFIILILGIGSVIANLNNISFIIKSLTPIDTEFKSSHVYNYVILYFVFNSFTRITSGMILDYMIRTKKLFYFLLIISISGFLSQIFGITMNQSLLYLSVCLAGMTHGGYMTFIPVYVRNEFGLNNMGKILGFLTTGAAIGSVLIADVLFSIFWEVYEEDGKCLGSKCFRGSYIITSVLFGVNIVLSGYLLKRYLTKIKN
jgi:MFS family permease